MKLHWIVFGCASFAGPSFGQAAMPELQGIGSPAHGQMKGQPAPQMTSGGSNPLLLVGGSDVCATAEAISGEGGFAFDNSAGVATTGTEGQLNTGGAAGASCTFLNATAIANDVWFLWTSTTTGPVRVTTCGGTLVDTKMAIYDWTILGSTCPPPSAASPAGSVLACNDDVSAFALQSIAGFNAVNGSQYLIQLGTFPGNGTFAAAVGGTGTLSIEYHPPVDATPCSEDDANGDTVLTNGLGGSDMCMIARHGQIGVSTNVSAVELCWGAAVVGPATANPNTLVDGTPATVCLWEDPTDDGNPNDAILIEQVATTVQNHDTDIYNTVAFSTTHTVSGYYYIGATYTMPPAPLPAIHHPFAVDMESCEPWPNIFAFPAHSQAWIGWNAVPPFNTSNLGPGGNSQVPFAFAVNSQVAAGMVIPARTHVWMIRSVCSPVPTFPGNPFCTNASLGTDHTTPCPCGNVGLAGNGCAHSFSVDGGNLVANGVIADDNVSSPGPNPVVLTASNLPATAFTLFMQHDALADTVFHDGVLCAGGTLIRLRGRGAGPGQFQPNGVAIFPNNAFANDSTLTLSSRGGQVPGNGNTRFYAGWYRNASTTFCPPATANVSNGWTITW